MLAYIRVPRRRIINNDDREPGIIAITVGQYIVYGNHPQRDLSDCQRHLYVCEQDDHVTT